MKKLLIILLAIMISGCASPTEKVSRTPSQTFTPSQTSTQTRTATITPTATRTIRPTYTKSPTPSQTSTPSPTATFIYYAHPVIREYEAQGYRLEDLSIFSITNTGSMSFGGTQELDTFILSVPLENGESLVYFQMANYPERKNLVFFGLQHSSELEILEVFDFGHIIGNIFDSYDSVRITPYGWMDINNNGQPDLPVSYLWANQYTGSELHIFEYDGETVNITTKDLPGIISPWYFDPSDPDWFILDLQWAYHECIYPPMGISKPIVWDGEKYVDDSANTDYSEAIEFTKEYLESKYGSPFSGWSYIPDLVRILVWNEAMGNRYKGWQEYLEIANPDNWPGTSEYELAWLEMDKEHFRQQYYAGVPFSANENCPQSPDGP